MSSSSTSDMDIDHLEDLRILLQRLRDQLEPAFSEETAAQGFTGEGPSVGQCAASSVVARELLGGGYVSTVIDGQSHWFNRLQVDDDVVDVDITGDQFGRPTIQVAEKSQLYSPTKERRPEEVNLETLRRAILLAERASLDDIAKDLRSIYSRRSADP